MLFSVSTFRLMEAMIDFTSWCIRAKQNCLDRRSKDKHQLNVMFYLGVARAEAGAIVLAHKINHGLAADPVGKAK
jgi:hypothetical protein